MPHLQRDDGVKLYFEVHGKGPAIILSHGVAVTSQMWRPQIEALSKDHTLVIWDFRGHGQSDKPDDQALYTQEATIADIGALLDHIGAQKAIVGGLSLGGYMSMAFYRDHPERCNALMLFDCGPGYRDPEARGRWNNYVEEAAVKFGTSSPWGDENTFTVHPTREGLVRAARGILPQRDASVMDTLANITVPTLIVHGDDDLNFVEAMEIMRKKIPQAYKFVAPGSGHYPNIDAPELTNAAVRWFLDGPAKGKTPSWIGKGGPRRQR